MSIVQDNNPINNRLLYADRFSQNQGLAYDRSVEILTEQVNHSREKHEKIARICALVVGVAVAIAVLALSIFSLVTIPTVPRWCTHCQKFHQVFAPGSEARLAFSLLGITLGFIFPGLVAGGLTYLAGKGISHLVLRGTKQFNKKLEKTYEDDATVDNDHLTRALVKCDTERQKMMIQEMNFEQLLEAKKALGNKRFSKLLDEETSEELKVFRFISKLSPEDAIDSLNEKLTSNTVDHYMKTSPLFREALQEQLKEVEDPTIQSQLQFSPYPKIESSGETVTLKVGENTIEVDRDKLTSRSGYFQRLFSGTYNDDHDGEVTILEDDVEGFSFLIDTLTADSIEYIPEKVEKLLPLAHKYQCQFLLGDIEHYLIRNFSLFSEDDLLEVIQNYRGLTRFNRRLETHYLSKKLTAENSETLTQLAQDNAFEELLGKCKTYYEERALQALRGEIEEDPEPLLNKCFEIFDDEERESLIEKRNHFYKKEALEALNGEIGKDPISLLNKCFEIFDDVEKYNLSEALKRNFNTNTFKAIFSIAKEHDPDLKNSCLEYAQTNRQTFKQIDVWELHETPEEIQQILYPEVEVFPIRVW